MSVYDPLTFRTLVARPGEVPYKFWAVNKLLQDMAAAGLITLIASVDAPANTAAIWLDLAAPEIEGGVPKAYSAGSWVMLTKALFLTHIGNVDQTITLTGDVTGSGTGTFAATLATVNSNLGSFGSASAVSTFTVNAKGLTTAAGSTAISITTSAITGLGTGIATWLGTPSSANLAAAMTDETGTGALVFATSPTLVTPLLGTPASGTLTNCTGFPAASLTGTTNAAQEPAHTGDVTNSAGSLAMTIAANAVTNAKAAQIATQTLKGRNTAATGNVEDISLSTALDWIGGTAQGSVLYRDAAGWGLLAPGTSGQYLKTQGAAANPLWGTLPGGGDALTANPLSQFAATTSLQLIGVMSDETGTGKLVFATSPTFITPLLGTPTSGVLTNCTGLPNAGLTTMAATTIKANVTGSTAAPTDATADQVALILPVGSFERGERLTPWQGSDFMHGVSPYGPFNANVIASGTANVAASGIPTASHPGVITIASSTTANSGASVISNGSQILLGGGEQFDCVFKTPAAFTSITTRLGFHDTSTSADAVDGCYLEISTAGVAVGKTSNNSTRTTSATIATLSVATWYHGRVKLNAGATGVDFTIYDDSGAQQGTVNITTNIPTASGRECGAGYIVTNAGTTAINSGFLDYMCFGQQGRTLARGALT